jgi:predicted ester cyclase
VSVTPIDAKIREHREATIRALFEAQNRQDLPAALAAFGHPRFELIGTGRVYDGNAEVARYLHDSRTAFPDQAHQLISLHHADDAVICEAWFSGTHMGEIRGLQPTGRRFRCRVAAFFLFEGDALVCQRLYFDAGTIARQLA